MRTFWLSKTLNKIYIILSTFILRSSKNGWRCFINNLSMIFLCGLILQFLPPYSTRRRGDNKTTEYFIYTQQCIVAFGYQIWCYILYNLIVNLLISVCFYTYLSILDFMENFILNICLFWQIYSLNSEAKYVLVSNHGKFTQMANTNL